jgi:hypothetical protein
MHYLRRDYVRKTNWMTGNLSERRRVIVKRHLVILLIAALAGVLIASG